MALLKPLDPMVAAFNAVRTALVEVATGATTARELAAHIGRVMHRELVLSVYEDISPQLFYEVTNDLDSRRSRSENHRYNALMGAARNKGLDGFPVWQKQDREQLGLWFVEQLRVLGMIDVRQLRERQIGGGLKEVLPVEFTAETARLMENVRELVELNTPINLPCIEPPKDWTSFDDGGWHTNDLRRIMPHCVNIRRIRNVDVYDAVRSADLSKHVLPAINHLQRVRWKVNTAMFDTVREIAKSSIDLEEVLSERGPDAPERPEWLGPRGTEQELTQQQADEFRDWKRSMAQWWTERKMRGQRWGRLKMALQAADRFKDYPALYFVHQADFRGRLYAQTVGISPQGSDLQKSLLHFAEGKPLDTPEAIRWFKINGANRFGVDKVSLDDRVKWTEEQDRFILEFADSPTTCTGWTEADKPLQFLAWAKEYAAWRRNPDTFLSHIPVGLDGSCNGLQHFSAMLRDAVGGKATNLVGSSKPNDIYTQVAQVTQRKLSDMNPESLSERDRVFRESWIAHGINRSLVKRSVMTLPYGATRFACAEFIVHDYLRLGKASEFDPSQYQAASNFLSHVVWESIGEVVVAASSAMSWLQKCAGSILKGGAQQIRWTTPSGFPVTQVYNKQETIVIRAKLFGGSRIWVSKDVDEARPAGHKNGLAPNFVHSMDASHMILTINACEAAGINSLAMIHDDYGTHPADTQRLYEIIRNEFVRMYEENDPILDFFNSYSDLPTPPNKGQLDIQAVRQSPYFFA